MAEIVVEKMELYDRPRNETGVVPGAGTNKETGDGPGVVGQGGGTMNATEIYEWDQMHSRLKWSVSYYSSEYPSVHFVYSFVLGAQVWWEPVSEAS